MTDSTGPAPLEYDESPAREAADTVTTILLIIIGVLAIFLAGSFLFQGYFLIFR